MRLGDACTKVGSGATPRGGAEVYVTSGVALIRSQNVYNDRFEPTGLAHIDDRAAKALDGVTVCQNDVLLNITGDSVARACLAPVEVVPARVNQHVAIIRPDPGRLDARFLRYWLVSPATQGWLLQLASAGATRNALTKAMISDLSVPDVPLRQQRAIADMLGSLDEHIELNRRISKTLEQIAAAVFRSRFIDFDVAEHRVESEMGWIPQGWHAGCLADVADVVMGQSPPSSTYVSDPDAGPMLVQGMGAFGTRFPASERYCTIPGKTASPGDLLITVRAPVGQLNVCRTPVCLGRGVAGVRSRWTGWVEFALRSSADQWAAIESGTIFTAVNGKQVRTFPLVVPSERHLESFETFVRPILSQLELLQRQNETLSEIRDTLLPKMMSSEVRPLLGNGEAA